MPLQSVKCGPEVISLDNWTKLVQYSSFRDLLGTGLNIHLMANDFIRDVFELGPPPVIAVESKMAKMERVRESVNWGGRSGGRG